VAFDRDTTQGAVQSALFSMRPGAARPIHTNSDVTGGREIARPAGRDSGKRPRQNRRRWWRADGYGRRRAIAGKADKTRLHDKPAAKAGRKIGYQAGRQDRRAAKKSDR